MSERLKTFLLIGIIILSVISFIIIVIDANCQQPEDEIVFTFDCNNLIEAYENIKQTPNSKNYIPDFYFTECGIKKPSPPIIIKLNTPVCGIGLYADSGDCEESDNISSDYNNTEIEKIKETYNCNINKNQMICLKKE